MKAIYEKLKVIIEKHTKLCVIFIFLFAVLFYGIIASRMTNAMFLKNDEELYVNMARAFFFEHNFSRGYEIINYSCVLYPIIISVAYFLYSPENITFLMRI